MNLLAAQARSAHLEAEEAGRAAVRARAKRDRLIRRLRAEDPDQWSLGALAKAVGCSRSLIVRILADEGDQPDGR